MTSPFSDQGHNDGFPAAPGGAPPPPPAPSTGSFVPPPPPPGGGGFGEPPPYQGAPPPGYQAYAPGTGALGLPRAGFGSRLGAYLLDGFLYGLVAMVFAIPGIILIANAFDGCVTFDNETFCPPGKPNGGAIAGGIALILAGVILVAVLYLRALGNTGQTWGRKIVGNKVVGSTTGMPIGVGRALGRQLFAGFISAQIFYLGYLWMLWDSNKQTWHDKVVDSVVVKA